MNNANRTASKEEDNTDDSSNVRIDVYEDSCHEDEENIFKDQSYTCLMNGDFISKYSYCT